MTPMYCKVKEVVCDLISDSEGLFFINIGLKKSNDNL